MVYLNFATKDILACLCCVSLAVKTISMIFPSLVNFYFQICDLKNIISTSTTYVDSFGADFSKIELF